MGCTLNRYDTYTLANVKKDASTGRYVAKLNNPPSTCSNGIFSSKTAQLKIIPGIPAPTLSYTTRPVISVSSTSDVQTINDPGTSFLEVGFTGLGFLLGAWLAYTAVRNRSRNTLAYVSNTQTGRYSAGSPPPFTRHPNADASVGNLTPSNGVTTSGPSTVVVNNGNNSNGLVEGMLLNEMLHDHNHGNTVNNTTIVNEAPQSFESDNNDTTSDNNDVESDDDSYKSDSNDSDSSFSSDSSDDSYSSDSSSDSYSSDSSDSFSSDSGSDFSSDSSSD